MSGKKKFTLTLRAQEMFALIERYKISGLTQRAFCKQEGIPYSTLQHWLPHYRSHQEAGAVETGASSSGGFLPLKRSPRPVQPASGSAIEIDYPNGVQLRFPAGGDISLLRELINVRVGE